ncbi:MAG: STAS/SEC14 domain-containing protein [Burkholderiales bacterium]|nr:STAS/SEC14 domain-containing protein [Bacteroidia bacterium]
MKTFDTHAFMMNVHEDLLIEFKVKKNINLQASDVWESRDLSVNHIPGKKFYVLFEGDDDAEISGDARRAGASEEYSKHVAALALYSNKSYERIIGSLFLKINTPKVPTKFFDNREEAIAWLRILQKSSR